VAILQISFKNRTASSLIFTLKDALFNGLKTDLHLNYVFKNSARTAQ